MVRYPVALFLLATASVAAAQQNGMPQPPPLLPGETLLQIAAHGSIKAVPDVATLSTSVLSDGPNAEVARARNADVAARLIAAVRAAGVPEDALRTDALRVAPRFKPDKDGDDTDVITGYRAETRLKIRLRDVATVSRVFDALSGAGATGVEGPEFAFADDVPLKARARAAAVASAQAEAADYAAPFRLHVVRVLRISERATKTDGGGDIVVTAQRRTTKTPPVLPGEQEVTADVWVDYALVPR